MSLAGSTPSHHSIAERRLPELDFLRGIAITLVLGRHMLWVPETGARWVGSVLRAWRNFGWMGVDLFFVLSGFLVGGLLIREERKFGTVSPGSFLVRRGLRIYPAFYSFLFGSVWLAHVIGLRFATWPLGFFSELVFLQNYIHGLWPQTWSLAVEEHFYLLLLCFLLWITKRDPRGGNALDRLPRYVLVINAVILAGRILGGYVAHWHWSILSFQTQFRLDSLLFGVLMAYGLDRHPARMAQIRDALRPWRWLGLPLLIVPSMCMNLEKDLYVTTFGSTALYLGFGWILLETLFLGAAIKSRVMAAVPFLPWVGRYSYSIYLWHFTVYYVGFAYIHRKLNWHPSLGVECLGFLGAAIIWGMVASYLIEQPALAWRDRWFPARATSLRKL